ncbi:MAG TPA: GDSL-type esterase/lipase family protein [Acidimicrobiales bacterium]|nr:GDSL-type esterase/lipase family protein [Acidimicrobiales bacterium]
MGRRLVAAACLATAAILAACSPSPGAFAGPPVQHPSPVVYLDVTDDATVPPFFLWRHLAAGLLPRYATAYETSGLIPSCSGGPFGGPNGSCTMGVGTSLAALRELVRAVKPGVVTIEAGLQALEDGVPARGFGRALRSLLGAVRAAGARTVLVADLPPPPPGLEQFRARTAAYDRAVASAASADGALVVDVVSLLAAAARARGQAAVFEGKVAGEQGSYGLTSYGEDLVARAFVAALRGHRI